MRAGGLKILNGFKYLTPSELWDYTTIRSCMIFSINRYTGTGIQGDPDLNRVSFRVSGFCAGGHGSCHFLYAVRCTIVYRYGARKQTVSPKLTCGSYKDSNVIDCCSSYCKCRTAHPKSILFVSAPTVSCMGSSLLAGYLSGTLNPKP